jgi:peptidoglycan hydrolase CwlO-like protein
MNKINKIITVSALLLALFATSFSTVAYAQNDDGNSDNSNSDISFRKGKGESEGGERGYGGVPCTDKKKSEKVRKACEKDKKDKEERERIEAQNNKLQEQLKKLQEQLAKLQEQLKKLQAQIKNIRFR